MTQLKMERSVLSYESQTWKITEDNQSSIEAALNEFSKLSNRGYTQSVKES